MEGEHWPTGWRPIRSRHRRWRRNVVATPWRWRWEWGVPTGLWSVADATHPVVAVALVAAVGVCGAIVGPGGRRWVWDRIEAVALQHRLRVGLADCGIVSRSGRLPAIVRTRVVDRGIRITLWLPVGVEIDDLRREADSLAVAAWVAGVEVHQDPRRAQIVDVLLVNSRSLGWEPT